MLHVKQIDLQTITCVSITYYFSPPSLENTNKPGANNQNQLIFKYYHILINYNFI